MSDRHFIVQRIRDRALWCGSNTWAFDPIAARWFDTAKEAELAALRELPDQRGEWVVREIEPGRAA